MQRETAILSTRFRYFLAVAEAGSIRSAAKELNVVPSAVNRQILMLESQLGVDLFERVGRGLRLSEAGALLLRHVRNVIAAFDDTAVELDAFRGLKRGRVRVAAVESVSVTILPDLLTRFWEEYPGIQVAMTVAGSEAVTRLVLDGEADLSFSFNAAGTAPLEVLHTEPVRIGALMAPDHPLAGRPSIALADLVGEPLALPARGLSLRSAMEPALARLGQAIRPRMEANSLRHMAALARRGRLVAFQTTIGIEQELAEGSLVLVPLSDPDVGIDHLTVLTGTVRAPSLAITVFADFVKTELERRGSVPAARAPKN